MILLYTDVMIDILRKYPLAISWLNVLESEMIGIPGLVAMELLQGCRNREEQKLVENTLNSFFLYWPSQVDCRRAFDDFVAYHLSHQLGILDALIAETAIGLKVDLVTFNEKHYDPISALRTIQPYFQNQT